MKKIYKLLLMLVIMVSLVVPGISPAAAKTIKLNMTKTSLYPDKVARLVLENASGKIKWTSSDESVVEVTSKGKITGILPGKATVTAKHNGIKYTCKVTVNEAKINATRKTITKGDTFKLKLIGDTISKCVSSDKSIAKVSSKGLVTGVKAGKTEIFITGESGVTYSCAITVKKAATEEENKENVNVDTHTHIVVKMDKVNPTCEKNGLTTGEYCASCGEILVPQEEIPALGHNFVNGYCKVCKKANPDEVHTHVFMTQEEVKPTCTTSGLTDGVYCATCNEVFKQQKTVPALGHSLVNGTCTRCEMHFHEKLEIKAIEVSCLVDGATAGAMCKYCGEMLIPVNVIKSPGAHNFGPDGHCTRCTADRNGHIHAWTIEKAVKATCEDCGFTEGKYCEGCGYREYAQTIIPPTGHIYANGRCRFCGKTQPTN